MNNESLNLIASATVNILNPGRRGSALAGQGVLINSGLILTLESCLEYDLHGPGLFALGEELPEDIETADGLHLPATPWMIEPVTGVALLGPFDIENDPPSAIALEDFILKTQPAPLFRGTLPATPLPVRVRTRVGEWVYGHAQRLSWWPHRVLLYAEVRVDALASGAPVVTATGELLGVVPRFTESRETKHGSEAYMAVAHLVLPAWATRLNYKRRVDRCLRLIDPQTPNYSPPSY